MSPDDIEKLLGGYATGTLTAEEQQALFAAALDDQELFDALAREQSLRDLLRDPAARAELLSALNTPANRLGGFWQWLRRPMVAGLATVAVVAIAVVAVWQVLRIGPVKPAAPMIVAELRPPEQMPAQSPSPPGPVAIQTLNQRRVVADTNAPAIAPPPAPVPAAMPAVMARKAETESTTLGQSAAETSGALKENVTIDARSLFYLDQEAPGANAFVQSSGGARAVPPPVRQAAPRADAAPTTAKTVSGLAAPMMATAPRLGVRVSILRGEREVDLTTVLDPGETVRLKLIPNADGFLWVAEGARTVASATAQRLKPFETPEMRFEGSGQKQLVVTLSRKPQTVAPLSLGILGRGNLVETSADQGRATYVVSGPREAGAQQVVVPVTLTYR